VAGITSMGVDALLIGPLPTPGVAYITRSLRADAGIVITASHNPYEDNGIKFFRNDGYKLDDDIERRIEQLVAGPDLDRLRATPQRVGKAFRIDDALGRYVEFVKKAFPPGAELEGLTIAVDAANGAAYKATPCVLRELGASLRVFNNTPDGLNINLNCGSTHPEEISRRVLETHADIGIAHDGDADRILLCDETGDIMDGDEVLAIAGADCLARGQLRQNTLVATVMSNMGLDECLRERGGRVVRTRVGDRHVIEEMLRNGYNVGGEQSGHIIFSDFTTTGDGIISALQVLRVMIESGKRLAELRRVMRRYPQRLVSLKVRDRKPLDHLPRVQAALRDAERTLGEAGRVLLRYSGTEPKIRLLLESRDGARLDDLASTITSALREELGTP
jgi:phosphoglucosamine mutase